MINYMDLANNRIAIYSYLLEMRRKTNINNQQFNIFMEYINNDDNKYRLIDFNEIFSMID